MQALHAAAVAALLLVGGGVAAADTRRIKVQHLSPYVGRHAGGLLINVTGRGFLGGFNVGAMVMADPTALFPKASNTHVTLQPKWGDFKVNVHRNFTLYGNQV